MSGQTGLMKNPYKTTRMFPLIPPPPFIITRGWKINIYNELLGIVETFAGLFDMRTFFYREFQNKGAGNGGNILLDCIIAVLLVIML